MYTTGLDVGPVWVLVHLLSKEIKPLLEVAVHPLAVVKELFIVIVQEILFLPIVVIELLILPTVGVDEDVILLLYGYAKVGKVDRHIEVSFMSGKACKSPSGETVVT